jgi:hypothetical protein
VDKVQPFGERWWSARQSELVKLINIFCFASFSSPAGRTGSRLKAVADPAAEGTLQSLQVLQGNGCRLRF